jgi:hypothetical protein
MGLATTQSPSVAQEHRGPGLQSSSDPELGDGTALEGATYGGGGGGTTHALVAAAEHELGQVADALHHGLPASQAAGPASGETQSEKAAS